MVFWYLFCFKILAFGYSGWVLKENMSVLCIRGFQLPPGPHKEHACFPTIPHLRLSNLMYFTSNMFLYWGNLPIFSYKSGLSLGLTLLRVFGEISLISPQKSPQNRIYYCCVPLNQCIKLKFYAFCVFALANYVFCGIFIPKCQIPCYM